MRLEPTCRKKISPFRAQYLTLSLPANLTDSLIDDRRFQRTRSKHHDTLFLISRCVASDWAQNDVVLERLQFQRFPGFQL
jgi:hypothetical protein